VVTLLVVQLQTMWFIQARLCAASAVASASPGRALAVSLIACRAGASRTPRWAAGLDCAHRCRRRSGAWRDSDAAGRGRTSGRNGGRRAPAGVRTIGTARSQHAPWRRRRRWPGRRVGTPAAQSVRPCEHR
jgi:hypothetical protein